MQIFHLNTGIAIGPEFQNKGITAWNRKTLTKQASQTKKGGGLVSIGDPTSVTYMWFRDEKSNTE